MNRLYILLTVMVVMVVAALFTAHESPAQGLTGCQNPQRVLEPVTATGNSITSPFTTTTNGFRVNYEGSSFDPAPPGSTAVIRILDEASQPVPGASKTVPDANADTSVFFDLPPGTYRVEINLDRQDAESKSYIVSVDECRETTPTPTGDIATCQNPQRVLEPVTATGNSTTSPFTTTTNGFRVNYEGSSFDPAPPGSTAVIRILDEASQPVPGASKTVPDANADTSVFFDLPPGTYRVEINLDRQDAESKSYIVSVDECRETTPTPTGDIVSCQNAREELRVGPRSGDFNDTFTTTGDFFFVNYEVSFDEAAPSTASAEIRIIDEDTQQVVEFVPLSADAADSFIVAQGAGTYRLKVDVDPDDAANYTVTVDDCLRTTTGTADTNVTETPGTGTTVTQTPGTGTTVIQTPGTGTTVTQDVVPKPKDVLGDTIPGGEPLPNTGGLSFLGLALALLTLLIIGATKVLLSVVRR